MTSREPRSRRIATPGGVDRSGASRPRHARTIIGSAVAAALVFGTLAGTSAVVAAETGVSGLQAENTSTPLALDVEHPRFSWLNSSTERAVLQTSYRIIVSSSAEAAAAHTGDVWDSGEVASDVSFGVEYAGPALTDGTRYHWTVQTRTTAEPAGTWADPTWFETGIGEDGWGDSQWLSAVPFAEASREPLTLAGAHWFSYPDGMAPKAPMADRYFRLDTTAVTGRTPVSADIVMSADDLFTAYAGGIELGSNVDGREPWRTARSFIVPISPGKDVIAATTRNLDNQYGGLLANVRLNYSDGTSLVVDPLAAWVSSQTAPAGWTTSGFDDASWAAVADHAAYGTGVWGSGVTVLAPVTPGSTSPLAGASWIWWNDPATPAPSGVVGERAFRKTFEVGPDAVSAELIMTADSRYEAILDGVVAAQMSGAADNSEPWKRARAVPLVDLDEGTHVLAVRAEKRADGAAGLVGAIRISYADGTVQSIPTDASWLAAPATVDGWSKPGFDDSGWAPARVQASFGSGPWGDLVSVLPNSGGAPLLRGEFTLDRPVASARLHVAAGGIVDGRLNGQEISDERLGVSHTDYAKSVDYATHDVTGLLQQGDNALLFELGRGFYSMQTENSWNYTPTTRAAGPDWYQQDPTVRAVLDVTYADGSTAQFGTNAATWKRTDGPTTYDSLYEGDFYDARLEQAGDDQPGFDDSSWQRAGVVAGPTGELTARVQPPIRETEEFAPERIDNPAPGVYVAVFPRQLAGYAELHVTGERGDEVTMRYGERMLPDGKRVMVQTGFSGGQFQTDRYILKGDPDGETWQPTFSYKGFRFVEITGWPDGSAPTVDDIVAKAVHTDVETVSTFDSSNDLFNKVHTGMVDTVLNNLHGLPTDTPAYEKNGWTGDAMLATETFLRNLDIHSFLTKWMRDLDDSRNADSRVGLIAPDPDWEWANTMESPVWQSVYVLMPYWVYEYTGDVRILEQNYDGMLAYADYLHSISVNGINDTALADYMAPEYNGNGPDDTRVAGTAFTYKVTTTMAEVARILGHTDDAAAQTAQAATIKAAFNREFFDAAGQVYRAPWDDPRANPAEHGYRQTHNVLALAFGLVPAGQEQAVADHLADNVVNVRDSHLWTGVLGTKWILPVLTQYGHGDLAYTMATQTTAPGWGAWFASAEGSTSMWENWWDYRSRNHYFLGTVDDWFYQDLVGISPASAGYREIAIAPQIVGDLTHASGSVPTPYGDVAVDWKREAAGTTIDVTVPVGTTATVKVPVGDGQVVTESGTRIRDAVGVTDLGTADGVATLRVGSGTYSFLAAEGVDEPQLDVRVTADSRCIASKATLSVTAVNGESFPVAVDITSAYGTKSFATVAGGKNAFHAFTTRLRDLPAGEVTVSGSAVIDGRTVTIDQVVPYPRLTC